MQKQERYRIGFNTGYLLAKYEPDLLKILEKNVHSTNQYLNALFCGENEYELERTAVYLKELQEIRNGGRIKDRTREL